MTVRTCEEKEIWHDLCERVGNREFLQSWEWGTFQASVGKQSLRLVIEGGVAVPVQGFDTRLPLGLRYLYCPRVSRLSSSQLEALRTYATKEGYAFVRVEPSLPMDVPKDAVLRGSSQPQQTMVVDITHELPSLLGQMHAKTRYNIHLATKKGVTVRSEKNVDIFWQLNTETTARDKFKSHDKSYYATMLKLDILHQLVAYTGDVPVASILLIAFGDTMTYAHGASSNIHRNLMAPYALQWDGMKMGKKLGMRKYDLGGVAPIAAERHRWSGITKFKSGFGGTYHEYPSAFDLPCQPKSYHLYQFIRTLRHFLPV